MRRTANQPPNGNSHQTKTVTVVPRDTMQQHEYLKTPLLRLRKLRTLEASVFPVTCGLWQVPSYTPLGRTVRGGRVTPKHK